MWPYQETASVLRQLFGDWFFGWMWPPESQVFVAIPKQPWWFQRFLRVKHARLEEMIYKYQKHGYKPPKKILKRLIGRLWCSILGGGDLYHRVSIQVLKKLQGRRSCRSFGQWIASSTWCCRHQFLASCWPRPILKDQNTTGFTVHQQITVSCAEAAPLAAYGNALASKPGISFSIQVRGP